MAVKEAPGLQRRIDSGDRSERVLNYPGLKYFYDKNEKRYTKFVNGTPPDQNGNVYVETVYALSNSDIEAIVNGVDTAMDG